MKPTKTNKPSPPSRKRTPSWPPTLSWAWLNATNQQLSWPPLFFHPFLNWRPTISDEILLQCTGNIKRSLRAPAERYMSPSCVRTSYNYRSIEMSSSPFRVNSLPPLTSPPLPPLPHSPSLTPQHTLKSFPSQWFIDDPQRMNSWRVQPVIYVCHNHSVEKARGNLYSTSISVYMPMCLYVPVSTNLYPFFFFTVFLCLCSCEQTLL